LSDTAYHSFIGEVEALNTTTIRRLNPSRRHQLPAIAPRTHLVTTVTIREAIAVALHKICTPSPFVEASRRQGR
jgi:hypothetical protein